MSILVKDYGVTKDGEQVKQYILENANGVKAVLLNYGAVVSELHVPDKEGKLRDVVWATKSWRLRGECSQSGRCDWTECEPDRGCTGNNCRKDL